MYTNSLEHKKYYIVFVIKYRRKEIYREKKQEIDEILIQLYEWK